MISKKIKKEMNKNRNLGKKVLVLILDLIAGKEEKVMLLEIKIII
jgi:hypothetical protein